MKTNANFNRLLVCFVLILIGCTSTVTPTSTPATPTTQPTSAAPATDTPHGELSSKLLLWSLDGGIAGFCDSLTVTADSGVTVASCKDATIGQSGMQLLSAENQSQLQQWRDAYQPFEWQSTDPATADAITTMLTFNGNGTQVATADQQAEIAQFAEALFMQQTAQTGACELTPNQQITLYQRPSMEAGQFGVAGVGDTLQVTMRSTAGWYGFDPGVAQAANVGVFRLRWVAPDADVTTTGACDTLPIAPQLDPTACYEMAMGDLTLFATPSAGSAIVTTLSANGYARVVGKSADNWSKLDLSDSSQPQAATAWLNPNDGNFSGACDNLPTAD